MNLPEKHFDILPTAKDAYRKLLTELAKEQKDNNRILTHAEFYIRDIYAFLIAIVYDGILLQGYIDEKKKNFLKREFEKEWSAGDHSQVFRNLTVSLTEESNHLSNKVNKIYNRYNVLFKSMEEMYPKIRNDTTGHGRYDPDLNEEAKSLIKIIIELQEPLKIFNGYKIFYPGQADIKSVENTYVLELFGDNPINFTTRKTLETNNIYCALKSELQTGLDGNLCELSPILKYKEKNIWYCIGSKHQHGKTKEKFDINWQPFFDLKVREFPDEKKTETQANKTKISSIQKSICRKVLLYDGFVGRDDLFNNVKKYDNKKLYYFEGLAGFGKSFFAAKISTEILSKKDKTTEIWIDCNNDISFYGLLNAIAKYLFEIEGLKDFKIFSNNEDYDSRQFLEIIEKNRVNIIFDDFHEISDRFVQDSTLLNYFIDFFESVKEVIDSSSIVITSRRNLDIRISEVVGLNNIFESEITGLKLNDYNKIIDQNINIDISNQDEIKTVHKKLNGHPHLFSLILGLIQSRRYSNLTEIIQDQRFHEFDIPQVEKWILDNIYSELNKTEISIVEHLALSRNDFSLSDSHFVSKMIESKIKWDKTQVYIENLVDKFILTRSVEGLWRLHSILREYCIGKINEKGIQGEIHRRLAYNYLPAGAPKPKPAKMNSQIDLIFNGIYHYFMAGMFPEAKKYLQYLGDDAERVGRSKDLIIAYINIKDSSNQEFSPEFEIGVSWRAYGTQMLSFEEIRDILSNAKNNIQNIKSDERLVYNLNALEKGLKAESFELELGPLERVNRPNELRNYIVDCINVKELDKAYDAYIKWFPILDKKVKKKYDPSEDYDLYSIFILLSNNDLYSFDNREKYVLYIKNQYLKSKGSKNFRHIIDSKLDIIQTFTNEELSDFEKEYNLAGEFNIERLKIDIEKDGSFSFLAALNQILLDKDEDEEDLNIDQEIKKKLKSIKMREESAFITPLIEQKLLVSRVSLESLKYRKARRENNKNFGDYDLSNFYNLINEANNQLNKYKLSNLWLLDIYGIPISIYKDKGEPISELSIDLCKKMMKIIFPGDNETLPVKNENWLSMNLTFCILNFLLLGDFKSVNDAFSRLHLENTNVVVNVFNKIFIDRDSSEEPKQFIENINVYKKTDDYLMLKDLFI